MASDPAALVEVAAAGERSRSGGGAAGVVDGLLRAAKERELEALRLAGSRGRAGSGVRVGGRGATAEMFSATPADATGPWKVYK